MQQELILYPALAMVILTFAVGAMMLRLRFLAVSRGDINPRYFLLNRGGKVPDYLVRVEQHYSNLLELPVLFYVLVLMLYVTGSVESLQLWLAWGYVTTRAIHTIIHVSVNKLRWRLTAFVSGALLLLFGWLTFLLQLAAMPA